MTAPESQPAQLQQLDPAALTAHPRNVRTDLGDLTGLTASIAAQGVLEPLTVVPLHPVGYLLVDGHRRAAAAIAAGVESVPCMVRTDWRPDVDDDSAQVEHLGAMLATALHRQGLTAVEEARGIQQMLDLGMPISKVAKSTGLDRKRVALAAGVARLDDDTAAAVNIGGLDLEQAAAVATYADDPDTAAALVEAAQSGPGHFAHALEQAKREKQNALATEQLVAELRTAGRTVLVGDDDMGTRLSNLRGEQDGEALTATAHAACPGYAVAVHSSYWNGPRAEEVCTNPGKYGHQNRWGGQDAKAKPETPEEKEAAAAERRLVIANNKAMDAANAVRRAWLKEFLARKSAPKELLRFCVETFAAGRVMEGWLSGLSAGGDAEAGAAMGLEKPRTYGEVPVTLTTGEEVPDARLPLQLFAHVAAAHETAIDRGSWRIPVRETRHATVVRWLAFLACQGYTLSAIEDTILDQATGTAAAA